MSLFIAHLKLLFRNRQQLFWNLAFPLIFTVIFGFFFGVKNAGSGTVVLINQANNPLTNQLETALKDTKLFNLKTESASGQNTAVTQLKSGDVLAVIVVPTNFGLAGSTTVTVIDDPANLQSNGIVLGALNQFLTGASFQAQKAHPIYGINERPTASRPLNYFDFVLVGLLGMALMNSSIQGVAITMSNYREDQILKRITTTPLPPWRFVTSSILARLVLNLVQIASILAIGIWGFNGHIYGNLAMVLVLSIVGAVLFQLFGFLVAGVSKTTQAAEGMSTAITIPMMFLAGVFFPISQLPKWLSDIVQYLPLAPLLQILRNVALDNQSVFSDHRSLLILAIWLVGLLFFSFKYFRLNSEE